MSRQAYVCIREPASVLWPAVLLGGTSRDPERSLFLECSCNGPSVIPEDERLALANAGMGAGGALADGQHGTESSRAECTAADREKSTMRAQLFIQRRAGLNAAGVTIKTRTLVAWSWSVWLAF